MSARTDFCIAPFPGLVYASPRTKSQFDDIPLPVTAHEWEFDEFETLTNCDGKRYERRCHSKHLKSDEITIIFQWFEYRIAAPEDQAQAVTP